MLALKHAPPRGFWKQAFHHLTAARLATRYPHGGIVIDGQLLHSNLARGLHREPFEPAGWHLFDVPGAAHFVQQLFDERQGARYDWFSLLAFVLPWRVRDRSRLYCYEWCHLAITGRDPSERVTPENLLALIARKPHHDNPNHH